MASIGIAVAFTSVSPAFFAANVEATCAWYREKLGFAVDPFPENPPIAFAMLRRGAVEIMLQRAEGFSKQKVERKEGSWDAYIRVDRVEELYDSLRSIATITSPLTRRFYGLSEFEVTDPNGYTLVFAGECGK